MEFTLSIVLFLVGLYAVITKRNLLKVIIGVAVMGYAINLFFILAGFRFGSEAPILTNGHFQMQAVDPLAQAMVLAAITLELSVMLLLTVLSIRLYSKYGTFDIAKINKLKG
jgi:multicomponent Na+:H+ antiporter subunit C